MTLWRKGAGSRFVCLFACLLACLFCTSVMVLGGEVDVSIEVGRL